MGVAEILSTARYVTDIDGKKTDVLIPIATWSAMIAFLEKILEHLEDQEDLAILQKWIEQRKEGTVKSISLNQLEEELIADGLLPRRNY